MVVEVEVSRVRKSVRLVRALLISFACVCSSLVVFVVESKGQRLVVWGD